MPEIFSESEIKERIDDLEDLLNGIKIDLKGDIADLKEAMGRYQGATESSIRSLLRELKARAKSEKNHIKEKYEEKIRRLAEAYDRQAAMLQEKINEISKGRLNAERSLALSEAVFKVYIEHQDDPFLSSRLYIKDVTVIVTFGRST